MFGLRVVRTGGGAHMRRLRGGRIINFGDWVARSGRPRYTGYLPYYVAKAAVIALTEALALELASDQILVNAIAPVPSSRRKTHRTTNLRASSGQPRLAMGRGGGNRQSGARTNR
jgi:NAD(P)-dependent dehydrogenase (short-subunit alcohol dehydrogenase family)